MYSCSGTYIDDEICALNHLFVVFDDYNAVSEVAEIFERVYEFSVVALVQSDARFVKYIKHSDERTAYLRCEPYSLRLAARKRAGSARERQITETYALQKSEARFEFFDYVFCYRFFVFCQHSVGFSDEVESVVDRHFAKFVYIFAAYRNGERRVRQTSAVTGRAVFFFYKTFVIFGHSHLHTVLYYTDYAGEFCQLTARSFAEIAYDFVLFVTRAVHQHVERLFRELFNRRIDVKSVSRADRREKRTVPSVLVHRLETVNGKTSLSYGKRGVGYYSLDREAARNAESCAVGASSCRIVEREHSRFEFSERYSVLFASVVR